MAPDLTGVRLALAAAATVVYVAVGFVVGRRQVSRESLVANRAFQAWWYGLAVLTLFNPLMVLMDYVEEKTGSDYFRIRLALFQFLLVGLIVAIGCLVYYLLYVYTGRSGIFWPVAAYHLVLLVWLMFLVTDARPIAYGPHCESSNWCYEKDFNGTPAQKWLSVSLLLPILLGALAYFALYFKVDGKAQKYRIAMVAGALVAWFGTSITTQFILGDFERASGIVERTSLSNWVYWSQVASPIISLLASVAIFLAYRPPRFVRMRLGDA